MTKINDLTGQSFGRLTAISRAGSTKSGQARWLCRCECGTERVIGGSNLRRGLTQSCGCRQREETSARSKIINTRHGKTKTPDWYRWCKMIQRCEYPKDDSFKNYGGRGITVCERWRGRDGFVNYMADMGPKPSPKHTVERVDNDGPYSPANCVWATRAEQLRNRRNSIWVEHDDLRLTLAGWSAHLGIKLQALNSRYKRGERGARLLRPTQARRHPAISV